MLSKVIQGGTVVLFLVVSSSVMHAAPLPKEQEANQVPIQLGQMMFQEDSSSTEPSTYLTDPGVRRRLGEAERLAKEGRLDQVLGLLQSVFDEPDESFVRTDEGWMPARTSAEQLLESLGEGSLARYREQRSDEAAYLLRQGVLAGDSQILAQVMRRYFLTRAGFEATNLLASHQLDRGNAALALVYLDRLLESPTHRGNVTDTMRAKRAVAQLLLGRKDNAKQTLAGIGTDPLQLGGNRWPASRVLETFAVRPAGSMESFAKAREWPVFGGGPLRSPAMPGGPPLMFSDWSAELLGNDRSGLGTVLEGVADHSRTQRAVLDFGLHPVAWGQIVYYRNFEETKAIHLETGQVLWTYRDGSSMEAGFQAAYPRFPPNAAAIPTIQSNFVCNSVYGTLSTDGERLYQIDELVLNPNAHAIRVIGPRRGEEEPPDRSRNRLTALDATTGKVLWTAGSVEERVDEALDGTFFLGPPLPVEGDLYVMGEVRSELRLYCLEPTTGKLRWSQVLALCQRPIDADMYRQTQAAFLAYENGILICPTNLMRIVALDPLTRNVLWHYPYAENSGRMPQQFAPMQFVQSMANTYATDPPIIEDGRVVISAPSGNTIHCLDLQTGRPHWRTSRDGAQYLLGSFDGLVILVGADHLRAHRLADGARIWRQTAAIPSGRGVRVGPNLLLPQADGAVIVMELATGKPVDRLYTRDRNPVGNLLVRGDHVMSSGIAGLEAFPMATTVLRDMQIRLDKNPQDASGLFRRAQIRLTEGKLLPAVEDLQVALGASDEALAQRARSLLFSIAEREALNDPSSTEPLVAAIGKLASEPAERGIYYRLLAQSKLARKDYAGALEAVEKHTALPLVEMIADGDDPVRRSPNVWTRQFVRQILENGAAEGAATLQRVDEKVKVLADRKEIGALDLFATNFAGLPTGDRAYQYLGDLLAAKGRLGEAEVAYLSVVGANAPGMKANALAGAGRVAEAMKEPADADFYYSKLARDFPKESVAGSGTGQATYEAFLRRMGGAGAQKSPGAPIDFQTLDVKTIANARLESSRRMILASEGELPYFSGRLFAFDHPSTALECYRQGSERQEWHVPLASTQTPYWPVRLESMGHVIFFALGDMIHGISAHDQKLLWMRRFNVTSGTSIAVIPQARIARARDRTGSICLTGHGFVAVNTGKELHLLDPWTGRDLWIRSGIESDQIVFGDEEYLFLVARDLSYQVHRTLDGTVVRKGRFGASFANRKAIQGRNILTVGTENGKLVARYWDPWAKETLWGRSYPASTKAFLGDKDELIVLTEEGDVVVLDSSTGKPVLNDKLSKEETAKVANLQMFRDEWRLYLAVDHRPSGRNIFPMPSMPANLASCHVNGSLRAYDSTSKKCLWDRELERLSVIVRPGSELPVLIGSGTAFRDRQNNAVPVLAIELIDKRNGKTLHRMQRDDLNPIADIGYDLRERWIELRAWNSKIRIDLKGGGPSE